MINNGSGRCVGKHCHFTYDRVYLCSMYVVSVVTAMKLQCGNKTICQLNGPI